MSSRYITAIREAFYNVQFSKTSHTNYIKKLKKRYELVDKELFADQFVKSLMVPLTKGQKHPCVENTLEFAANFAISINSVDGDETEMSPFLAKLFDFLLRNHAVNNPAVRFRVCHFMNILLNSMGEDAFIEDTLCDRICSNMMDRLLDKSSKVRAQAVFALHRLQDPVDEACPVIKIFLFHLSKDPHAEVRRAILANMCKNRKTVQAALKRTRDVSDTVRKMAYQFISKITMRSLTIEQRGRLLSDGLKDRSDIVSNCVKNVLLPSWVRQFNGDYIALLTALDVENSVDTSTLALNSIFQNTDLKTLMEQLPVDSDTKVIPLDKLTSASVLYWRCLAEYLQRQSCTEEAEEILPELSKFCDYIREFLGTMGKEGLQSWEKLTNKFILHQLFEIAKTKELSDEFGRGHLKQLILDTLLTEHCSTQIINCIVKYMENVIPNVDDRLTRLADVINELRIPSAPTPDEPIISADKQHEINMKRTRMKVQLLEVTEEQYQAIQNKDYLRAESLKKEIEELNHGINELNEYEQNANAVASDKDDNSEECNDPEIIVKCLEIMCAMMDVKSVKTLTPTLRSLMEVIVLPKIEHQDEGVRMSATKAVAICCLLDKELAKRCIMMFFLIFSRGDESHEVWLVALKSIFDLLLFYGFEHFEIAQNEQEDSRVDKSKKSHTVRLYSNTDEEIVATSMQSTLMECNSNFIKILTSLLDNENQNLRTVAAEGLCKLLLQRRICSASLVSRLLILWHSPLTEEDFYLRQCLCGFFGHFVSRVPESQEMLEEAFLPMLRTLANAPDVSPLQEIDPYRLTRMILDFTRPGIQRPTQAYCPHNNLAFAILAEILNEDSDIEPEILIRSLKYLEIQLDDNVTKENLHGAVDKVMEMVGRTNNRLVKDVVKFKERLDALTNRDEQPQELVEQGSNAEPNTRMDPSPESESEPDL